ncbi:hypothetical protein R1flu_010286 [Riccia fluitans]|uniref:Phytocyanin domain-containing protein n=1 Tax=Riccia fluitans TaxID=41844 RepID=A0ABD1Z5M9_9MARC
MALLLRDMLIIIFFVALGLMHENVDAVPFTVGGNTGWTIPPSSNYYDKWAAQQIFQLGDTLVFKFTSPSHDVMEVSPADVASCNTSSPILTNTSSNAVITLETSGTHSYICSIGLHCSSGMRFTIEVQRSMDSTPAANVTTPTLEPNWDSSSGSLFRIRHFLPSGVWGVAITAWLVL